MELRVWLPVTPSPFRYPADYYPAPVKLGTVLGLSGISTTPGDNGESVIARRVVLAYWLLGTPGQFDELACCAHIFDRRKKSRLTVALYELNEDFKSASNRNESPVE
jgi:hypothetical protein